MARQRKVTQQTVADGSRLTGCVTRTHGRHHYVTTEDGNIYEAHRRGKKSDVVVGDIVTCSQPSGVCCGYRKHRAACQFALPK